jgi:hypothetical protein
MGRVTGATEAACIAMRLYLHLRNMEVTLAQLASVGLLERWPSVPATTARFLTWQQVEATRSLTREERETDRLMREIPEPAEVR